MNGFEPDAGDSTGARAALARSVETLLRAAQRGDSARARRVVSPSAYELVYPVLAKRLQVYDALDDGLRSVTSLGIVSLPWNPEARRAYVRLAYAAGTKDLSFGWQGERLLFVTYDEGRPFPVLYPAAPIADGGYAAWDTIRQRAIRFRVDAPRGAAATLRLTTSRGEVIAKRVR